MKKPIDCDSLKFKYWWDEDGVLVICYRGNAHIIREQVTRGEFVEKIFHAVNNLLEQATKEG